MSRMALPVPSPAAAAPPGRVEGWPPVSSLCRWSQCLRQEELQVCSRWSGWEADQREADGCCRGPLLPPWSSNLLGCAGSQEAPRKPGPESGQRAARWHRRQGRAGLLQSASHDEQGTGPLAATQDTPISLCLLRPSAHAPPPGKEPAGHSGGHTWAHCRHSLAGSVCDATQNQSKHVKRTPITHEVYCLRQKWQESVLFLHNNTQI